MLPPVMDHLGFDIVFSGHDHVYGRTVPLKGGVENTSGTIYAIAGSTGSKYYSAVNDGSFFVFNDERKPVYITASASDSTMTVNAIRPDGTVVDSFTI